jgi:glycosyltransferase involved in cell wall biosynthesis
MTLRLCLTGNEPRQSYLFEELARAAEVVDVIPFEDVDVVTRYLAAGLSLSWPRSEWWYNYHMHPLVQRRHRKVLSRGMRRHMGAIDALVMWGSWFHPFRASAASVPFYPYVDQSHTLGGLPGEPRAWIGRRRRAHALQRECYRAAGAIFCMSDWARRQTLESYDLDASKVISVGWGPCGVDLSGETPSQTPHTGEPIVLHVSNNFYRKGLDFLVETAEIVCAAVPSVRFVVVGKDMSGFAIPSTTRVQFLGRIRDKARLQDLFRSASLFFLPHRFDRSPHVLIEAMSAGLPLVASAQGGAIELIEGQSTGYACRVGATVEYAEAIVTLLRDPGMRRRMGEAGRALVRTKYNWPTIAEQMVRIISTQVAHR